jgi:pyruvate/2-oxoglutarate dehydrogenase complex dihydrolipoamide dehydrogenase (E3) component
MKSKTSTNYDAIIIGVGQAGKPLALGLAAAGWKTAIIERKYVGGSCVNYGCTPTKTLLASAEVAHQARRSQEYGIHTGTVDVDYKAVKKRKDDLVKSSREGIAKKLEETQNITLIRGEASFTGPNQIEVTLSEGGSTLLTAERIFINTGTHPTLPELDGLGEVPYLTAVTIMDLEELPEHLIILGGGYIGLEFSQMFRRFGSKVTLIEQGSQLLDREDEDIAQELTKILEEEAIDIQLTTEVTGVHQTESGNLSVALKKGNKTSKVLGSHLLIAIGTTPNTAALHLDAAGIAVDEEGYIKVNDQLETTQSGIYALGDCKGGPEFTHIAYDDYRVVRQNLLEKGKASIAGRMAPYTVFTDPQLGRIGLSEKEAKKKNQAVKIASMPMKKVARAYEMSRTNGLLKVLIDPDTDQILGAAMLGMEGGEMMSMLQIAMMGQVPYTQLRDGVLAHPTLAESLNNLFQTVE